MNELLKAELDAISKRIAEAPEKEKAWLLAQFGERLKHLKERVEANSKRPEPPAPKPPDAPK